MTYKQHDYVMGANKPRPINQSIFPELSMLEHKFTDLMQGPNGEEGNSLHISLIFRNIFLFQWCTDGLLTSEQFLWFPDNKTLSFVGRNICQTDDQQGTSGSHSKQCTLKRLGSMRVTQNDEVSNACHIVS